MTTVPQYTPRERVALVALAAFGFVALNGTFVYALIARPRALAEALANPVALAFIVEALVMVAVLAYLLARWKVSRRSWVWFVALSLIGGLAFALPVVLLWGERSGDDSRGRE